MPLNAPPVPPQHLLINKQVHLLHRHHSFKPLAIGLVMPSATDRKSETATATATATVLHCYTGDHLGWELTGELMGKNLTFPCLYACLYSHPIQRWCRCVNISSRCGAHGWSHTSGKKGKKMCFLKVIIPTCSSHSLSVWAARAECDRANYRRSKMCKFVSPAARTHPRTHPH